MIQIGPYPIVWHIMQTYARHGFKKFVLCTGYKSESIKEYFLNYTSLNSDFSVDLQTNQVQVHSVDHDQDWTVTVAYTGELTMTGGRIGRATKKYLGDAEHFAVTYGDGVTDANFTDEFKFHCSHNQLGTVLGVNPPSRFGELKLDGDKVVEFAEKPDLANNWINGGFFFFRRGFAEYLSESEELVLEKTPLIKLADDGQLAMFKHRGFWQCMDTQRDCDALNKLWNAGNPPWLAR
jgi:glucose-1-phosphate cytidylyltransferase